MKYAIVNGVKTNIRDVEKGTIGFDCWYRDYQVKACKGHYMQYWKYIDQKPVLPEGYENETEWHECWKSTLKDEFCEVICGENNEHRADILTDNHAIEIQYSSISYEAARERTDFYHNLKERRTIWIVNVYKAWRNKRILTSKPVNGQFLIKWNYSKKWVVDISNLTNSNVFLDISPTAKNMILIWKHNNELYGKWVEKNCFYKTYLEAYSNHTNDFKSIFSDLKIDDYI